MGPAGVGRAELEASHTADTGDKRLKGGWYRYVCP